MKIVATLALSLALCGFASAAPITSDQKAAEVVNAEETAGNVGNSTATHPEDCMPAPIEAVPEPATVALLGIGLGLLSLRRKI